MNAVARHRAAAAGMGLSAALLIATTAVGFARGRVAGVGDFSLGHVVFYLAFFAFSAVGGLIARRRPENAIGWLLSFAGVTILFSVFAQEYAAAALLGPAPWLPFGEVFAWLSTWLWVIGSGGFMTSFLLFPSGRLPSLRWRAALWAAGAWGVAVVAAAVLIWPIRGPRLLTVSLLDHPDARLLSGASSMGSLVLLVLGIAALIVRFAGGGTIVRLQLKWLLSAVALMLFLVAVSSLFRIDVAGEHDLLGLLNTLAVFGIPAAIGIAILKYRLYDIDVIINRTLVYTVLTAVLVGVYALGVLLFRTILDPVTGDNDIAIAASTLAVATLFGPARRRIQSFIDRRFYRSRYDAQQTLEGFAQRLREEVDLDALSAEVVAVIGDTVQPAFAGVWLANRNDFRTIDRYKESHERDW